MSDAPKSNPDTLRGRRAVSAPHHCGYLPDRIATHEYFDFSDITAGQYHFLLDHNFRRSGRYLYRPICDGCRECRQIRVPAVRFSPDRTQRRNLRRNRDLHLEITPLCAPPPSETRPSEPRPEGRGLGQPAAPVAPETAPGASQSRIQNHPHEPRPSGSGPHYEPRPSGSGLALQPTPPHRNPQSAIRLPDAARRSLYARYLAARHADPEGMTPDSLDDFLYESCVPTQEWSYFLAGRLVMVAIVDVGPQFLSAVYCYFDPDPVLAGRSLGTYNILQMLKIARRERILHVYLGYYVRDCPKMNYKSRFQPCEILDPNNCWTPFGV